MLDREEDEDSCYCIWLEDKCDKMDNLWQHTHLSYRFSYPCTWQGLITLSKQCTCRQQFAHTYTINFWEWGLCLLKHMLFDKYTLTKKYIRTQIQFDWCPPESQKPVEKSLEDEATTKGVKRSPNSPPPGLRDKIKHTLASSRTAIWN